MPNTVSAESSVFRRLAIVSSRKWPSRRLLKQRLWSLIEVVTAPQSVESLFNDFTLIFCILPDFMNLFINYEKVLTPKRLLHTASDVLRVPFAASSNWTTSWQGLNHKVVQWLTAQPEPWVPVNILKLLSSFKEFHKRRKRI